MDLAAVGTLVESFRGQADAAGREIRFHAASPRGRGDFGWHGRQAEALEDVADRVGPCDEGDHLKLA